MAEPETTGTPDPNDTDAQKDGTSGTSETDDRNAQADNIAKLNLEWKVGAEESRKRAEAAERELADIKSRLLPADDDQDDDDDERLRLAEQRAREWAKKDDAAAEVALYAVKMAKKLKADNEQLVRDIVTARQLDKIPDEAEREEVYRHIEKNPHLRGNVNAARATLRNPKLEAENKELRAQVEKLSKVPDRDVVRTVSGRDYTASGKSVPTTGAEFDERMAYLKANDPKAATLLSRDYAQGKIKLKDD